MQGIIYYITPIHKRILLFIFDKKHDMMFFLNGR